MSKLESRSSALRLTLISAACAGLLSGCASYETRDSVYSRTDPATDNPIAVFDRLDTNRDGFLSRGEVEALGIRAYAVTDESATTAFHRLDQNRDGFLSRAEAQSMLAGVPGASFEASDTDRNGFLSLTEALPHLRWLESRGAPGTVTFDTYDTNRDGLLSRAEADPLLRSTQWVNGRYVVIVTGTSFDRLDMDRDGFLSRTEAASVANAPTFNRYDLNRDGFLSRSEADALFRSNVGGTADSYGGTVYGPRY